MISAFRRDVDEMFTLLGYYAALSGSSEPTFRDSEFIPPSRVMDFLTLELIGCLETSVQNCYSTLRNVAEDRCSQTSAELEELRYLYGDTRWRSWLRNCATNRQGAGSIPDGISGFFSLA
jgi:hypothetical protein